MSLDTGVVLASIDRREPLHHACRDLIESRGGPVVIPAPALCEIDDLLHVQTGTQALLGDVEPVPARSRISDRTISVARSS